MGAILRICDFIFVLRPVILIPAWSIYLLGAAESSAAGPITRGIPSPVVAFCLTAILATAYLLNQIFDRESDELNGKCLFLASGLVSVRTLVFLALAAFLAASYAYHHADGHLRATLVAALVLGFVYSLPPLRLCARPFLDLLANAVGYGGIAFVLGFGAFSPDRTAALVASLPYVFLVAATFLHTTILDVDGDRASGKKTTSVLIGLPASRWAAVALHAAAFAVALWTGSLTAALVTGATFPAALYPAWRRAPAASSFAVQANTAVVALAAAVYWPVLLAVVAPLVALSRFYHGRRFGITYPGPSRRVSEGESGPPPS